MRGLMCHETDGVVLPLLRPAAASADAPRPHRAYDEVDEARAALGLALLASEALPGSHAREFGCVLQIAHGMLGRALAAIGPAGSQGSGR